MLLKSSVMGSREKNKGPFLCPEELVLKYFAFHNLSHPVLDVGTKEWVDLEFAGKLTLSSAAGNGICGGRRSSNLPGFMLVGGFQLK
ncbi:hypothetical protein TNIN_229791 [Trichonephila inaurata madagascariensis]|uniref:Uncharacterized protein n=1 Tax=Trichonephila inaurata madagascariensis TaxID=2747483 RepID=A0A8X6X6Q8_9ARAC|nr:hypothetical protein TNIN_229791 [Trichonephila inaurata madagascariensis]